MNFEFNYEILFLLCYCYNAPTTRGKVHAANSQTKEEKKNNISKIFIL